MLSAAPPGHVAGATHLVYLPLSGGGVTPAVGGALELTPDGGATETFAVLQVDQVPGRLGHRAVWVRPE